MPTPIALTFLLLQATASVAPAPAKVASIAPPPPAASSPAADPAPAEKPDPVMCDYVQDGASFMSKKVCHKASVWARMARGE